ncbi:hypothetical protein C8R44DRAFT_769796 [Mycena epipterygia]|nr:hypothetical protein C8R44DRAFT_769796 [Mycena epipterygia]
MSRSSTMLFNNLALIAVLTGTGMVTGSQDARRLARLGRVVVPHQGGSCINDNDCPGSEVCCSGLVRARSCIEFMFAICRPSDPGRAEASVHVSPRMNAVK